MRGHSRRTRRERTGGVEPFIGRACPQCGSATVVTPCRECGDWFVVCDCHDEAMAVDRFLSSNGRCANCRVWSCDDDDNSALQRRPARRAKRGGA